ncbi:MAG: VWA-like domain-containing protein, partial [Thiobacillaceae bacterium]|nr:VWA-like domain-containing protein [Thiobacillaceae bacterium]
MSAQDELAAIETKLAAARTRLILDKPFLGTLVMHLALKPADPKWCETTATDARHFYYNPRYIARLTLEQTQFVLAHEAMHCALSHFNRRQHRRKHRWDVACDYAVNMILDDERLRPPEGALMDAKYRGLTAEEIYPLLHEDPPEKTQDMHLFDDAANEGGGESESTPQDAGQGQGRQDQQERSPGGGGQPQRQEGRGSEPQESSEVQEAPPAPPHDLDRLDEQWKSRLAAAAHAARQAGKLSPSLMRMVDALLAPQLPWRALLARYMMNTARDDYSFLRASRRDTGAALLPRLHSQAVRVVVAIDTSGSIKDEELKEFVSEIDALKGQVRAAVTVHACDDKLCADGPWHFEQWEPIDLPEGILGKGGTDFRPVFEWVARERLNPDLLVYFTDAEGRFPTQEPPYPVLWLVKGKAPVPFGVRVQL